MFYDDTDRVASPTSCRKFVIDFVAVVDVLMSVKPVKEISSWRFGLRSRFGGFTVGRFFTSSSRLGGK